MRRKRSGRRDGLEVRGPLMGLLFEAWREQLGGGRVVHVPDGERLFVRFVDATGWHDWEFVALVVRGEILLLPRVNDGHPETAAFVAEVRRGLGRGEAVGEGGAGKRRWQWARGAIGRPAGPRFPPPP